MCRKLILISIFFWLAGCATADYDKTADWTAKELYEAGRKDLVRKRFDSAIDLYQKIEVRFPYGSYAQQASLEAAYAQWKYADGAQAIATCDRFIREHPKHLNVSYAYYLKGYIYLSENMGMFSFLGADLSERDPTSLKNAFETFRDLIALYPESKYSKDARMKMRLIVNTLAEHDVNVAEYYYGRGYYVASVGRAKDVIQDYPETPAIERALVVLVESYEKMGLEKLRDDSRILLSTNFPENSLISGEKPQRRWKFW